jgi:hypothetical protein
MKYDDASWHYGGNYPSDLPNEAGATHSGMFVAWAVLSGLAGPIHLVEFPEMLGRLQRREITPGRFLIEACDEKFTNDDLNDEGNAFAKAYFDFERGSYIADYERVLASELETLYHVADTWENFDLLKPVLDRRLDEWRRARDA